ncbi:MAG: ABC transporter ATP-binding protein/permease, partial [Treponema sp.]|nr:ABC transporter ATP-binding protein/permease [Treponema sp.]
YGLDLPEQAALEKAALMSALERDIAAFADGSDTLIGERGLTLSGGQKQRVAIARAQVMNSEILILDDSLSAVDAETERKILDALLLERKGKTTIIISHRVSTLRYADKVLVLDGGRQSEYGSPAELANSGGFYSRMAALQQLDSDGVQHG